MAKAESRAEAIDETYTALRRTIGAFHTLHRRSSRGRLTRPQGMLLWVIAKRGQMSPKELAGFLGLTQGTVTTAVDKLEARGYLKRTRSTKDRRVVHVQITPRSARMMHEIERDGRNRLAKLFEGWSAEEIETLRGLLERLSERAWEECGPPPFMHGDRAGGRAGVGARAFGPRF